MTQPSTWSLDDMFNKINGYAKVLSQHGYTSTGTGIKSFSSRHTHANGTHVDVRNSDWTMYDAEGKEVATGIGHKDLKEYLLGKLNREELLAMLLADE